ncbi:MAG: hypothetical protein HY677_05905 [Chloroflexi bacterium]|nr:hypothetical protein [Chloroflexota bacterium]
MPELEGTGGDEKYVAYEKKVAEIVPPGASEMEESRILAREGIRRIVAHPLGYVRLAMVKAVRFWYGSDSGRYELFLALMQFPILAMGLLGAGIAIARGRGNRTLPFLLVIVYFWTIHAIALAFARYSVPSMPLVIMLAVYGVIELWHMVSQRQEREEALSPTL